MPMSDYERRRQDGFVDAAEQRACEKIKVMETRIAKLEQKFAFMSDTLARLDARLS
jgi:uncharacterized coiled-coil protein SlyX